MPSLILFSRRSIFGGDDLQPTSILTVLARASQFLLFLLPVFIHMSYETESFLQSTAGDDEGGGGHDPLSFLHYLVGGGDLYNECPEKQDADDGGNSLPPNLFPLFIYLYMIVSLGHITISIWIEYQIFKLACIGSPTKSEGRNPPLAKLLERKWIWLSLFTNLCISIIGLLTCFTFRNAYYTCRNEIAERDNWSEIPNLFGKHVWWICLLILVFTQLMEFLIAAFALGHFWRKDKFDSTTSTMDEGNNDYANLYSDDSSNDSSDPSTTIHTSQQRQSHHELMEEMWDDRCRTFCKCAALSTCYLFGGRELVDNVAGDYGPVSRALADYFEDGGVLDLVASDIAAGFMMLARTQRHRVLEATKSVMDEIDAGKKVEDFDSVMGSYGGSTAGSVSGSVTGDASTRISDDCGDNDHNLLSSSEHNAPISSSTQWGHADSSGFLSMVTPSLIGNDNLPLDALGSNHMMATSSSDVVKNTVITERLQIDEEFGPENAQQSSMMFNDMFSSVLQPMPYSSVLVYPDMNYENGPLNNLNDNNHSSILTLKMTHNPMNTLNWYEPQRRKIFSRNDEVDRMIIEEGARFARHALSIYTWLLYVYMNPVTGLVQLAYKRLADLCRAADHSDDTEFRNNIRLTQNSSSHSDKSVESSSLLNNEYCMDVNGDNCWKIHETSLLAHSGLEPQDLIYANFSNKYNEMPYCIVLDHKWQSVVISIRGTLSLEDCMIDVLVEPKPLDKLGEEFGFNGEGQYCHAGVLSCALKLYDDLKRHKKIDSLMVGENAKYSHYTLRLTGHSLGAGCATLIGFMLRQKFPTLRVVCISPPGCFISWRLATECQDFVNSFVLDSDLIPRLSIETMEHLRNEVLELIGRIRVSKMEVVRSFVWYGCLRKDESDDPDLLAKNNERMLLPKGTNHSGSEFISQMERFRIIQNERKRKRGAKRNVKLFPPGKLVHLVKTGERSSCLDTTINRALCGMTNAGYMYTPVYVNNDDLNEILVSPTGWSDHFPNRVCVELERIASTFGIDTTKGSSQDDRETAERARNIQDRYLHQNCFRQPADIF